MAFSHDPQQTYIYQVDGVNEEVRVLPRETLEVLTAFGDGGRQPGQFYGVRRMRLIHRATSIRRRPTTARLRRFLNKEFGPCQRIAGSHGRHSEPSVTSVPRCVVTPARSPCSDRACRAEWLYLATISRSRIDDARLESCPRA